MQDMEGTLGMREGVDCVSSDDHQWSMYPLQKLFLGEPSSKQAWGVLFTGHLQGFTSSCFKPLFYAGVTQVVCNFHVYAHVQGFWEPLTASVGKKAGRVRLSTFYKKSLYSHWRFTEKVLLSECSQKPQQDHKHIIDSLAPVILLRIFEVTVLQRQCEADYLRKLGALDDSDPQQPQVIMANYMMACISKPRFCHVSHDFNNSKARPNCLEASGLPLNCIGRFFQICLNLAITSWFGSWFTLETYLPFFEMLYRPGLTIFVGLMALDHICCRYAICCRNECVLVKSFFTHLCPKKFRDPKKSKDLSDLSRKNSAAEFSFNLPQRSFDPVLLKTVNFFCVYFYLQVWSFGVGGWS